MKGARHDSRQDELALSSIASHSVFPGRRTILVSEMAHTFSITPQQVLDLVMCGDLVAVLISASRAGTASSEMTREERQRIPRSHWRIPVSAFDAFVAARKSSVSAG